MSFVLSLWGLQLHRPQAVDWLIGWLLIIFQLNGILIELGALR